LGTGSFGKTPILLVLTNYQTQFDPIVVPAGVERILVTIEI
jgi:hypothetical protein